MHQSVMRWVGEHAALAHDATVLEVGSYDVNGGVRSILACYASEYVGVDVTAGPGVDVVCDGEALPAEWAGRFGLVVSTECLEHAARWWRVVDELARVCAPGGHVLVTARGFDEYGSFVFHNPPDRHRLGPGVLRMAAEDAGLVVTQDLRDPQASGWFLAAQRPA